MKETENRFEITKRVGLFGIIGNIFLLSIKAIVGFSTKSQAMIADSINSAGDIFASIMTSIGNKIASVPRDDDHNFGHGKAEYIFSLFISISMIFVSIKTIIDAFRSLINGSQLTFSWWLIVVCIATIITKLCLYIYVKISYKKCKNILLQASMEDHRNDCIITTFTLISALLSLKGIQWFDGIVGIGISAWICKTGIEIFIESYNILMDRSIDEKTKDQVAPKYRPITSEYLDYDEVMERYDQMMEWLADLYVNVLNLIHYMHDKYYYEAAEMALIDTDVKRTFATGIAGFSHVVDSLSAIKYAKVTVSERDPETGIAMAFKTEGDFPKYGNDDDRADDIAVWLLKSFLDKIKKRHTYRNSEPTTSILTITSNVVYGKFTGNMPDGRKAGTPLAPGANPSYGAEQNGLLASLNSLTKLPYEWALDGISNTQTMNPDALGHDDSERVNNLVNVMDGYFDQGAHHLNVNVFGKDKLLDAMEHPEKPEYANFTIRVSGYAVKFIDLTKEQQMDVISRTFHDRM